MKITRITLALIHCFLIAGTATATATAATTGTLQKIERSGTIHIGVRDSVIPFSYLDDKQSYQGYSIDLCLKVVEGLRQQPGLSGLKIKMVPVTPATRIPLMANGTVDMECGSTTNNLERQKQVAFSPTTFVAGSRFLSLVTSQVATLDDMKGKRFVTLAGSTTIRDLLKVNAEKKLDLKILTANNQAEAFLMVETGRADAFMTDDILLASLMANARTPADFTISQDPLSVEPYAIMIRRDDPEFKAFVDSAIGALYQSGQISPIYKKWFQSAIPPKGINLNTPMSKALKAVIARPTDSGDPQTYLDLAGVSGPGAIGK
ncbi:amino acid ABC transporter substrate-binding protein [Actimicrobium sp. CCI2.3]|uniref:amino acid ABC transporter substrate-binding protein n=1 Tax=Actimicrobium sp. CCI2.3 TaxID=3048616 RepID=UPI002AB353B4|nr:amino acid ABC transporter substrate-binding protein [Actimicrobium sp. CCI2.3]MDY7574779.1 amino acid ABC transporter substrate-binding protein [Actimicrobium sp. CCI2.3]MEB0020260.1 amino acid ABC transporter substrate-binding protein [Actimicrobium sp. CCI2.3]